MNRNSTLLVVFLLPFNFVFADDLPDRSNGQRATDRNSPVLRIGKIEVKSGAAPAPDRRFELREGIQEASDHGVFELEITNPYVEEMVIDSLRDVNVLLVVDKPSTVGDLGHPRNDHFRLVGMDENEVIRLGQKQSKKLKVMFDLCFIPGNGFLSFPKSRDYMLALETHDGLVIQRFKYLPERKQEAKGH